jgi:hypothetical protein
MKRVPVSEVQYDLNLKCHKVCFSFCNFRSGSASGLARQVWHEDIRPSRGRSFLLFSASSLSSHTVIFEPGSVGGSRNGEAKAWRGRCDGGRCSGGRRAEEAEGEEEQQEQQEGKDGASLRRVPVRDGSEE